MVVLSHYQVNGLFQARQDGLDAVSISPDLGLSKVMVPISSAGAQFPGGFMLSWEQGQEILSSPNSCFLLEPNGMRKIQFFSAFTSRAYSLYPTQSTPTMLISGIPMHRIKNTDPFQDTLEKVKTIHPLVGRVLDTATGLGYTAIQAAKTAEEVITVELDPAALEVARLNPWSQALFGNPKIEQHIGDSFDTIENFEDHSFSRILHDPPAFSLAGHLYSLDFYRELYRVLRNRGKVFHYIGDPDSKSGRSVTAGVIRRLEQAGFYSIRRAPRAFGVVAEK